jgi:2,4-dienoyl-CoA reductase-like NADH-dependent reductase (Old Yellow Enzyme family)
MNIVEIAVSMSRPAVLHCWHYDDNFIPGLAELAAAIKAAGEKACIQLWHGGRKTSENSLTANRGHTSAIACPMICETPMQMTVAEIKEVMRRTATPPARQKDGDDASEVHGELRLPDRLLLNAYSTPRGRFGGS